MTLQNKIGLSLLLISLNALGSEKVDFRCSATECVIPYDQEGYKNGLEVCSYSGEKLKEVTWKKGVRQGPAKCFKGGDVSVTANYDNDELNGLYIQHKYDSNGDRVHLLKFGVYEGYEFAVDDKGKVTSLQACYEGGDRKSAEMNSCAHENYGKFSKALSEYRETQKKLTAESADKEAKRKNGPQIKKHANGKTRATYTNVDGRIDGQYKEFSKEEKLLVDCYYKKDKKHGNCLIYDTEGRLDSKSVFDEGKLSSEELYYDNGKLSSKLHREKDELYCVTTFIEAGPKDVEYCYFSDRRGWYKQYEGSYVLWSSDGYKIVEGQYKDGREIGLWRIYSEAEALSRELTYEKGVLVKSIDYLLAKTVDGKSIPQKHRVIRDYFPDGSVKNIQEIPSHDGESKPKVI